MPGCATLMGKCAIGSPSRAEYAQSGVQFDGLTPAICRRQVVLSGRVSIKPLARASIAASESKIPVTVDAKQLRTARIFEKY
jgi:hypothetical protein